MKHQKLVSLSLFVTFGLILHTVENMIPLPFPVPGAKLGLANIISLLAIVLYGFKEGLTVSILRCIIGALIGGSLSSLLYSLTGAVISTYVMAFVYKYFKAVFSLIGISILGGVTHNFVQIAVASVVLSTFGIFSYLPYLMIVGLFTGFFTGLVAIFVNNKLSIAFSKPNYLGGGQN